MLSVLLRWNNIFPRTPSTEFRPQRSLEVLEVWRPHDSRRAYLDPLQVTDDAGNGLPAALSALGKQVAMFLVGYEFQFKIVVGLVEFLCFAVLVNNILLGPVRKIALAQLIRAFFRSCQELKETFCIHSKRQHVVHRHQCTLQPNPLTALVGIEPRPSSAQSG